MPKQPRVNPGTLLSNPALAPILDSRRAAALRTIPEGDLRRIEEKYDVDVAAVFGPDRWRLSTDLTAIVVLA
ncbi:MAG: hypothetical protein ACREVS_11975 [Burkholderiales bacterium]